MCVNLSKRYQNIKCRRNNFAAVADNIKITDYIIVEFLYQANPNW